jgi:hypothetical protein
VQGLEVTFKVITRDPTAERGHIGFYVDDTK